MDKVDNRKIECMVCASCTFKGKKRQKVWKIGEDGGEAGRTVWGGVEEERNGIVEKLEKKDADKTAESMVRQRFPQGFMYEMLKLHEVIE